MPHLASPQKYGNRLIVSGTLKLNQRILGSLGLTNVNDNLVTLQEGTC